MKYRPDTTNIRLKTPHAKYKSRPCMVAFSVSMSKEPDDSSTVCAEESTTIEKAA